MSAVIELYDGQLASGLNQHPHPRGPELGALLQQRKREERGGDDLAPRSLLPERALPKKKDLVAAQFEASRLDTARLVDGLSAKVTHLENSMARLESQVHSVNSQNQQVIQGQQQLIQGQQAMLSLLRGGLRVDFPATLQARLDLGGRPQVNTPSFSLLLYLLLTTLSRK